MDCIIEGNSIRPFCAAIACLSRVGKEINFDFDPIDGLTLRSLNDSKSIFASFHYEPSFFQKCCIPQVAGRKRRKSQGLSEETEDDERWSVRVSMKALAPLIRPRKDVLSLQIVTVGDLLSFEFQLQRASGIVVKIIYRVGYSLAQSVAAIASTEGSSELVVQPQVLLTMLEPLRRATEIALLVNETHKLISGVTFAHDDIAQEASSNLTKPTSLKTETSIGYDELIDLEYMHPDESHEDGPNPPPADLNEQVVLVFTLKEFKAMLQYCAQAADQSLPVSISFFWGGKPMVVKTNVEGFSGELVMATLDHKLMASMKTSSTSGPRPTGMS